MGDSARKSRPYRGARRGRWSGGTQRPVIPQAPAPPLGEILVTIQHDDLEELEDLEGQELDPAQITETKYLTSYNWLGEGSQQIMVPGEPPMWTPLSEPTQLRQDSGQYYWDSNAARHPSYPLEPMIQAILSDKPEFPLKDVDIIACGSTLGNLLRFARHDHSSFRMLVEVVGNTVFFIRRHNSPTEKIPNVWGYGHSFPEAYTTWSKNMRGCQSHQRVLSYNLAGMSCLVRVEADGYLPDLVPEDLKTEEDPASDAGDTVEDLLSSMQGTTVSGPEPATASSDVENQKIEILKKGRHIPQDGIFDLKTRSAKKIDADILKDEIARLWIKQVPNFIVAYHVRGTFNDVRVQDVRDLKKWEEAEKPALIKFAGLLQMVVAFARSAVNGRIEIEHEEGTNVLNLREQAGVANSVLPSSLMSHWDV
ncbi:hypothetical protein N7452_001860 [Penicillium brevicompactum]|uniref:Geranylgeranyl pyrophosphate synthetase n=1 Tax=Penicillium brevicompactum TaxID=5074 RepID=A0A9W9US76_PENBR|nr:hypothetical protein N7452_001860 [Penicillium brevicompactum]